MSTDLVVIGAGGFGRETLDVIEAANEASGGTSLRLLGVVDDRPSPMSISRLSARGIPWLGTIDAWLARAGWERHVIAVGDPAARHAIDARLGAAGRPAADAVIHPAATVGSCVDLSEGTVVCAGAQVSTNVVIGRHTHLNPNSTIGHDAVLGDCVSINPGAIVSGEVVIEADSLIGAGSVVLQGLHVGRGATVGAAACVTRDVAAGSTVKGIPAR